MRNDDDPASAPTRPSTEPRDTPASHAATELSPRTELIAGRYEVLGLLGMGGMGRVYRVRDRKLDELAALKLLRRELVGAPGMLDRFLQEVKLARRVTSPHVVRTFDLGEHESDHFLTMEYVEGSSLAQLLEREPLSIERALHVAHAVCAGIAAAHAAEVLHRDLKPDNILVARSGRIAISDFGIARALSQSDCTGATGTPAYMAPEQVDRSHAVGPPADVYAFGAILFEMLTGRRPFQGADALAMAEARLRLPPPDPRTERAVPDAVAELVLRCMAREPSERYRDATVLAAALASLTIAPQPAAPAPPTIAVPTKRSRSVAIVPLRATAELTDIADGLSEELVDALTQTRELRVRPLTSVRVALSPERDARAIGSDLDVDVVVEGSLRRRGEQVRIAVRVIGVADGFVLWANHLDTAPQDLLAAGDQIARAIARALTVEIELAPRAAPTARAIALYLEAKAKLRAHWAGDAPFEPIIAELEQAHALAPDEANILAALAMAMARRASFLGADHLIDRALVHAERALELAPSSGEAWLALALRHRYAGAIADSAAALTRAVACAPGLVMAQAMVGAVLLEAGALDEAISHLEAARELDPQGAHVADLPRAYMYQGRLDDALALLSESKHVFDADQAARFRSWHGQTTDLPPIDRPDLAGELVSLIDANRRIYRTRHVDPEDVERFETFRRTAPRLRARATATAAQHLAEAYLFANRPADALEQVQFAVDGGLQDLLWLTHCPLLAPLRDEPRFRAMVAVVADRAAVVLREIRRGAR